MKNEKKGMAISKPLRRRRKEKEKKNEKKKKERTWYKKADVLRERMGFKIIKM